MYAIRSYYEILNQLFAVDDYFTRSIAQKNAGDGGLPSSGTDSKILDHMLPLDYSSTV